MFLSTPAWHIEVGWSWLSGNTFNRCLWTLLLPNFLTVMYQEKVWVFHLIYVFLIINLLYFSRIPYLCIIIRIKTYVLLAWKYGMSLCLQEARVFAIRLFNWWMLIIGGYCWDNCQGYHFCLWLPIMHMPLYILLKLLSYANHFLDLHSCGIHAPALVGCMLSNQYNHSS